MGLHTSYDYDPSDADLYTTDGYTDQDGVAGTDADVAGTEVFSGDIDLTVQQGAEIHFMFDADGSTDDLRLALYKRNDATWTGNEIAWKPAASYITVANDGTETEYHFTIPPEYGSGHYRWGMVRSGTTNSFDIHVTMRQWRPTRSKA